MERSLPTIFKICRIRSGCNLTVGRRQITSCRQNIQFNTEVAIKGVSNQTIPWFAQDNTLCRINIRTPYLCRNNVHFQHQRQSSTTSGHGTTEDEDAQVSSATSGSDRLEIIEDVEDFTETEDIQPAWVPPVSLNRGKNGVFEVDELVALLKEGKAYDICVLKIPTLVNFVDYMVIVSALSPRHMLALTKNIDHVHKRRKTPKDGFLKVEGLNTNDWYAIDMGNIMLHIFMPEVRDMYDIETLWTVGKEYDSQKTEDIVNSYSLSDSDLLLLKLGLDPSDASAGLHSEDMGLDNRKH